MSTARQIGWSSATMKGVINRTIRLFRRPRSATKISEETKTALEKAIQAKDDGRYTEALHILDEIIRDDPDIPVALFIKALVIWDGFKDSYTAKLGLQRVKELVPKKNDKLNRMASELMEKIDCSGNYER